jgi:hypothetical protein
MPFGALLYTTELTIGALVRAVSMLFISGFDEQQGTMLIVVGIVVVPGAGGLELGIVMIMMVDVTKMLADPSQLRMYLNGLYVSGAPAQGRATLRYLHTASISRGGRLPWGRREVIHRDYE